MLCSRCKKLPRNGGSPEKRDGGPQTLPGWERLKLIICAHCGDLLPPADPRHSTLEKLTALARFGLSAGTSTILEP
jgi:hypothetical protein